MISFEFLFVVRLSIWRVLSLLANMSRDLYACSYAPGHHRLCLILRCGVLAVGSAQLYARKSRSSTLAVFSIVAWQAATCGSLSSLVSNALILILCFFLTFSIHVFISRYTEEVSEVVIPSSWGNFAVADAEALISDLFPATKSDDK